MRPLLDILYNFRWVRQGEAARASQAHFGGLQRLMTRHGLKAIINLRGENSDLFWWRYERAVCERLGARHYDTMLDSRKLPTRAMLAALIAAFDEAPRPFLLKCSGGQDRTGFAASLYLIHRQGWGARAAALEEFAAGARKQQRWSKLLLAHAEEESGGGALGAWIKNDYEPQRFAAWLDARGQGDSFAGIFERPRRSPWQL